MSATTSSDLLASRFAALSAERRRALVIYITAGHPDPVRSIELMQATEESGADVLEVGVPFSDPMADGPAIQESSRVALEHGITFDRTLAMISQARLTIPVVLFTYLNPVLSAGPDALERAAAAGAHGLLITDLPVGADPPLEARFAAGPLAFVRLVAPTTPTSRMAEISRHGGGFVYLISRLGVTGARESLPADLPRTIERLREAARLPICVGFGISTPAQAREVAALADGVVVGSAVVRAAGKSVHATATLIRSLREAIDDPARA
ncbi:MAG TPA: tryptophan synthase subunit alpha [Gemmatimonadaceae bacterium]|nr:tryptophan synthase subunit alpha [Gemmatimonadaceae bacterium]